MGIVMFPFVFRCCARLKKKMNCILHRREISTLCTLLFHTDKRFLEFRKNLINKKNNNKYKV